METICMKCQILFSGKTKENIIYLSSAELVQSLVKVKVQVIQKKKNQNVFCYSSRVERKTIVTQTYFWNPCLGATWTPL